MISHDKLKEKKQLFKRYLKEYGIADAIANALIKLYQETNKPDDAIRFIRTHMCKSCISDDEYDALGKQYIEAIQRIQALQEEIENYKGNLKRTNSEIISILLEGYVDLESNEECNSLLKNHLTRELFDELVEKRTTTDTTLLDIIQSGIKCNPIDKIGAYAADFESFYTFKPLLEPIILDYHNNPKFMKLRELHKLSDLIKLQPESDWGPFETLAESLSNPGMKHVKSVRLEVVRSLKGYPYFQKLSKAHFIEIEEMVNLKNIIKRKLI